MKKNKLLKNLTIFAMIIMIFTNFCYAAPLIPSKVNPDIDDPNVGKYTSNILGTMRWIGYAIAIGMLVFIGIKYLFAAADEKASMKGMLIKVAIGSFIIVFANVIITAIVALTNS